MLEITKSFYCSISQIYTPRATQNCTCKHTHTFTQKNIYFSLLQNHQPLTNRTADQVFSWSNRSPTNSLGFFHRKIYVKFSCSIRDIWINLIHANLFCCLSDHATALERIAPPLLEIYELAALEFVEFCCTTAIYKRGFIHFLKKLLHQFLVMASSSIHII